MGSSGSKTVASSSSSEDASRCRCRHNNNNKSQPSCSSSSPSCSCLGLLRTRESHTRLHLLAGEEEREEGEDENEDKQHNQQQDDGDDNDNTTCSIPPPPPPPPPPSSGARPRFSFIPSNFTFRLTRAASFGSSSTPADPSPLPLPSSFQHHHSTPVRFSRTLSVGRLRDRVLRPNSSSPSTHHHHHHHLVEHTTDFLERRRRIRSQVRALQRLGSRFENLSGHDRSCIMAGQYRSGRCTCNRTRNLDDDTSARASISRIVMLAEALFEVLDEIHQQSVVLSSRSFVSSLGSIPAPKEVVDSMPVKIYTKLQKHQFEDVSQCYICLLEYEEGDCMRILPCHHEFHQTCIDKWLKEIHRVCPLCRGDVCRSDSLS